MKRRFLQSSETEFEPERRGLAGKAGLLSAVVMLALTACDVGVGVKTTGPVAGAATNPASAAVASSVGANIPAPVGASGFVPSTNFVPIRAGSFQRQKYKVTLTRDFWMGRYEVTQAEYAEITGRNPSHHQGPTNAPVEKVSQVEARAFCGALTQRERAAGRLPTTWEYRLPTEAEWEYACRAGSTNYFSWGENQAEAEKYAWTLENAEGVPHPVGQKLPNPWGLYDIHGNVWEWTLDWFALYPESDVVDPVGASEGKGKVFRGGGWNNEAQFARSASRFVMSQDNGIHFVGFRVVLAPVVPRGK